MGQWPLADADAAIEMAVSGSETGRSSEGAAAYDQRYATHTRSVSAPRPRSAFN